MRLLGSPEGIEEALDLVDRFDDALACGFARLGGDGAAAMSALAAAFSGTPLAGRLGEAAEKVTAGSVSGEHLAALAGGRAALFGAVHDALLADFDATVGRERAAWPEAPPAPAGDDRLAACRAWLHELAITGWRGVDNDLVSAVAQPLAALPADPALRRPAVLLDGLAAELRSCCPIAAMAHIPARRWADLWMRALLLAQPGGLAEPSATPVSGRLTLLGADVHEHGTAVRLQVHAVLEDGDRPRLVRMSLTAGKVDVVTGPPLWLVLSGITTLRDALARRHTLRITDMPLLPSGDLLWDDERARPDEPADPFTAARVLLGEALAPPTPPLERHPVCIAEPVLLEGYRAAEDGSALDIGDVVLPVATNRLPACGPITPALVAASTACLGLMRWDGGHWLVQPFAVQVSGKRGVKTTSTADWARYPFDADGAWQGNEWANALPVLQERAGRLLRK